MVYVSAPPGAGGGWIVCDADQPTNNYIYIRKPNKRRHAVSLLVCETCKMMNMRERTCGKTTRLAVPSRS